MSLSMSGPLVMVPSTWQTSIKRTREIKIFTRASKINSLLDNLFRRILEGAIFGSVAQSLSAMFQRP
jgi:hypothetical protein